MRIPGIGRPVTGRGVPRIRGNRSRQAADGDVERPLLLLVRRVLQGPPVEVQRADRRGLLLIRLLRLELRLGIGELPLCLRRCGVGGHLRSLGLRPGLSGGLLHGLRTVKSALSPGQCRVGRRLRGFRGGSLLLCCLRLGRGGVQAFLRLRGRFRGTVHGGSGSLVLSCGRDDRSVGIPHLLFRQRHGLRRLRKVALSRGQCPGRFLRCRLLPGSYRARCVHRLAERVCGSLRFGDLSGLLLQHRLGVPDGFLIRLRLKGLVQRPLRLLQHLGPAGEDDLGRRVLLVRRAEVAHGLIELGPRGLEVRLRLLGSSLGCRSCPGRGLRGFLLRGGLLRRGIHRFLRDAACRRGRLLQGLSGGLLFQRRSGFRRCCLLQRGLGLRPRALRAKHLLLRLPNGVLRRGSRGLELGGGLRLRLLKGCRRAPLGLLGLRQAALRPLLGLSRVVSGLGCRVQLSFCFLIRRPGFLLRRGGRGVPGILDRGRLGRAGLLLRGVDSRRRVRGDGGRAENDSSLVKHLLRHSLYLLLSLVCFCFL